MKTVNKSLFKYLINTITVYISDNKIRQEGSPGVLLSSDGVVVWAVGDFTPEMLLNGAWGDCV